MEILILVGVIVGIAFERIEKWMTKPLPRPGQNVRYHD